jgi:NAD-dependent deacetylase
MLDKVAALMTTCSRAAVLTGAGISAESGVPTFRGSEGLWGKFRPEELATMDAFLANPKIVWEWYNWRRDLIAKVRPNPGHYAIAEMAGLFDDFTLITQNVDGLHRRAGSSRVLELHGNINHNKCASCHRLPADLIIDPETLPVCPTCGGKIRPDVVWFGEMLPEDVIEEAFAVAERVELFFSIGTSAIVHPAASLPVAAKRAGATLIEINPEETPLTPLADFHFAAMSGELLPELLGQVRNRRRVVKQ